MLFRFSSVMADMFPVSIGLLALRQLLLRLYMERLIHSNLTSVLESPDLISVHQFGFRKHHSTTHLLLEAVHDWAKALECRDSCHCLCLDFAKAFDSVPHHRLLLKLTDPGYIWPTTYYNNWIDCFLIT